jgi:CRISPR/Cas system-associated exonuclease Cas4 (RecB family)
MDERPQIVVSPRASERLEAAARFLSTLPIRGEAMLLAANREAADDLVRTLARGRGALFGIHRMTLNRLAGLLASDFLLSVGLVPAAGLAIEAVTARVVHRIRGTGALEYFEPVVERPGFPSALARTISELRLARIEPAMLRVRGATCEALANALVEFEAELERVKLADRAAVLDAAAWALRRGPAPRLAGIGCVMLDVAIESAVEADFIAALCTRAPRFLATIPSGDARCEAMLSRATGAPVSVCARQGGQPNSSLRRLQDFLFSKTPPEKAPLDETVIIPITEPGEMHECVELARRIHAEARRGVPFDRVAIICHSADRYAPYLEEALGRAEVPCYFAEGSRRPEPGGRALLALLSCARENLSAKRFAEYLSLAQVPDPEGPAEQFIAPSAEILGAPLSGDLELPPPTPEIEPLHADPAPVVEGTVRAPWRWERLLVDASVIGSRDRWARRLAGLEEEFRHRRKALAEDDDGKIAALERQMLDLSHLKTVALPIIDYLATQPAGANWEGWLAWLRGLAALAIRERETVLAALAELEPMGPVVPSGLDEVFMVLAERLGNLERPPARRRYGAVFVGPPSAVRGMEFETVMVPGLAERMFPKKLTEDPILADAARAAISPELKRQANRADAERLALRLGAGAASRRIVFSYSRVDLDQGRPRVPSFYALEVLRAAGGELLGFDELARRASRNQVRRLGWPAPSNPQDAIDTAEYDLAVLEKLVHQDPEQTRGAAHYLLNEKSNEHLPRALRARARRWRRRWTPADGLVDPTPEGMAALAHHGLSVRAYSPTALQHYAACPYRFLLQAIMRLEPREEAESIEVIDPLTRGALFAEIQFELLTRFKEAGAFPISLDKLEDAYRALEQIVEQVARKWHDDLAPAIERVWHDGIDAIRADLREWLRRSAGDPWRPERFELAFGLPDRTQADPASATEAIDLDGGLHLRGSIDLVERDPAGRVRVTDHKTGKVRAGKGFVIGGGKILQPALYALAAERMLSEEIVAGRLYYCTAAGGYEERVVPIDNVARTAAQVFIRTVGDALENGFLPAAPAADECRWCNYRPVCGPYEEQRVRVKLQGNPAVLQEKLKSGGEFKKPETVERLLGLLRLRNYP